MADIVTLARFVHCCGREVTMQGIVSWLLLVGAFGLVTALAAALSLRLLRATRGAGSAGSSDA
jgi:hypothetical protein